MTLLSVGGGIPQVAIDILEVFFESELIASNLDKIHGLKSAEQLEVNYKIK